MANLAAKYRPKTFDDVSEQSLVMNMVQNLVSDPDMSVRNFLFTGPAGTGKAQPMYSQIYTPSGCFIFMKDVKLGDAVYTHNGNIGYVEGIFPQGVRDVYRLHSKDGRCIDVSDEHLNIVDIHDGDSWISLNIETQYLEQFMNYIHVYLPPISLPDKKIDRSEIVTVEYLGKTECQCIYIDHPDHTYISDNFTPTHNTTTARIIANVINEGQGEPIEIDAASHSGVEAIRDIVAQARTYPVGSKWKVFILDEVHSISNQGWQVLLKTLEEGPARSIFLMATTNPEKIPATILSRVQVFRLSKISLSGIVNRLKYIIDHENQLGANIAYDDSSINFIAKMANGGMRDAITLLEKAIAYDTNITSESLVYALGLPNYDDFFALLSAYASKNNEKIAEIVDNVYNSGVNYVKWMNEFHAFVINVVKYILLKDITRTTIPAHYQDKISKYGTAHSTICLKLANKLMQLNQDLKSTQYLQEVTLTYLCSASKK